MQELFSFWKDVPVTEQVKPAHIFFDGYFKGKPRPIANDKEVKLLVIEQIMPEILRWLGETMDDDNNTEDVTKQLLDAIEYSKDGYEMARDLERDDCWSSNSELVDVLDGLDFRNILDKVTILWIKDNDVKPLFKVGDIVRVKTKDTGHRGLKQFYCGEITNIRPEGTYTVCIEELGHVKTGSGIHGSVINWEKVEAAKGE